MDALAEQFPKTDLEVSIHRTLFTDDHKVRSPELCMRYIAGYCHLGSKCPYTHKKTEGRCVCKYWYRGMCQMGASCKYLHLLDTSLLPECKFFSQDGVCPKRDCPYLHIRPEDKRKECPFYKRGVCSRGSDCTYLHVRKQICPYYLAGFCPDGPRCSFAHPRFDPARVEDENAHMQQQLLRTLQLITSKTDKITSFLPSTDKLDLNRPYMGTFSAISTVAAPPVQRHRSASPLATGRSGERDAADLHSAQHRSASPAASQAASAPAPAGKKAGGVDFVMDSIGFVDEPPKRMKRRLDFSVGPSAT